eukprot:scaffold6749_cov113-Cylindrotheca_fusiformis.AAC.1
MISSFVLVAISTNHPSHLLLSCPCTNGQTVGSLRLKGEVAALAHCCGYCSHWSHTTTVDT